MEAWKVNVVVIQKVGGTRKGKAVSERKDKDEILVLAVVASRYIKRNNLLSLPD